MHTEYTVSRYHDGSGEKAKGWYPDRGKDWTDFVLAQQELRCCARGTAMRRERGGGADDVTELRIVARDVSDWHDVQNAKPVRVADFSTAALRQAREKKQRRSWFGWLLGRGRK